MSSRTTSSSIQRARPVGFAAALGVCLGCAQVLGVPSDPELVTPSGSQHDSPATLAEGGGPLPAPLSDPAIDPAATAEPEEDRVAGSDGLLSPDTVSGIAGMTEPAPPASPELDEPPLERADAGVADAGGVLPPPACEDRFERVPVDFVFVVDNSGSMAETSAAFEQSLPTFAALLEEDDVDYRIILLSRHRRDDRSVSEEASTSVCIAAPLSGLAACPSAAPLLGPRFFQYSIKIDDQDSFQRVLQAFATPDPFGLTAIGWSEWLRAEAQTIFIEITDSDSALPAAVFTAALQAAAPASFGDDPARPRFVFHSITGIIQKFLALDIYSPDEPIETAVCGGRGSDPDNAGVVYQELSRATGGLRLSVCPAQALGLRLAALASDATLRSFRECPDPG